MTDEYEPTIDNLVRIARENMCTDPLCESLRLRGAMSVLDGKAIHDGPHNAVAVALAVALEPNENPDSAPPSESLLDFIERGIEVIERADMHIQPDDGPDGFVTGYRWPKTGSWHRILGWMGMAREIAAARRTGRDIGPLLVAAARVKSFDGRETKE